MNDSTPDVRRRRSLRALLLSTYTAMLLGGCLPAGGAQMRVTASMPEDKRFPPASDLGQIASQPAPANVESVPEKDIDSWDVGEATPGRTPAVRVPTTPWEHQLAETAAKRNGLVWASEGMHCLARETGVFFLAHNAFPNADLIRFMAARCGATDAQLSFPYVAGGGFTSDDLFLAKGRDMAEELMSKYLASGNLAAGIWAGRSKGKVVIVMPVAPRRARFDQVPIGPEPSGHVVLRGEVLTDGDRIEAVGNYGRFGYRRCTVDASVRLPRFAIDCETKSDDASSTIEIATFAPGRIVGPMVATLVVWPSGRMPTHYVRPDYGSLPVAGTESNFPANMATVLNQVRKEAGLGPVVFNADESTTAARVAPHFFAAQAGAVPETIADRVVLGLRAGWQIPGLVGHGHFVSTATRSVNDATALLLSALNRPSGRETLLATDVKVVAIGATASREKGILSAIFTGYSLLDPATPQEVGEALTALNAKRKERGMGPASLVDSLQPMADAAARSVERGEKAPEAALQEMIVGSMGEFSGGAKGWLLAADTYTRMPFPDDVLTASRVAIGVAHFRPKGSPWGAHGVFIVTSASGLTYAERSPHHDALERQIAKR